MTPTQRAAALRLIEFGTLPRRLLDIACRVRVNECLFHDDEFVDDASHALKEAIDLLRELAAEPVQEPVGWLNEIDGEFEHSHKPWMDNPTEEWHPVYTAPQQLMRCPEDGGECGAGGYCRPEPQQHKPLSDEQIESIVTEWWGEKTGAAMDICVGFARIVERAHGITGEST